MSIQSELTRIRANVLSAVTSQAAILSAIADKGVTVPPGATLHDVPRLIGEIPGRAPEPVTTVTIGSRAYRTVTIGNQEWLAENLDFKFQYNGTVLPIGTSKLTATSPGACYVNDSESSYGIDGTYKCGLLYNWFAVKYLEDNKATLLPEGWHVPTYAEWTTLFNEVGGISAAASKLKAATDSVVSGFPASSWGGDSDSYRFSLLPTGTFYYGYGFDGFGVNSRLWTPEKNSSDLGLLVRVSPTTIDSDYDGRPHAMSVRLVKDVQ